jgi:hypothetical protein
MDPFIVLKTIRLKETHSGEGIYITLNGKQISEPKFDVPKATRPEDQDD